MNDNSYNPYTNPSYQRSAYPSYQQTYGMNYNYQNYNQNQYETGSSANLRDYQGWNYSQPQGDASLAGNNDAVANEMKQQKAQLHKQREDYVKKVIVLRRELELLRNQKHELVGSSSPPRDLDSIVRENEKLQDEIQTKMKAITNVIEMLSSIIKDGLTLSDLEHQLKEESPKKCRNSKSPNISADNNHFNYIHYDPELHWCRMCDKFPRTAKEFLVHLQSKRHQDNIKENDVGDNTPWHKLPAEPELPQYEGAPKKRIPIKGLQFFIAAPSWYCKLCDVWIGDLHCASQHLKSQSHFQNYQNFIEQNPHWEMEWLKDREKALSRADKHNSSDSENSTTSKKKKKKKDKRSETNSKDKKRKKRSKKHKKRSSDSSSSSSSSSSSENEEEDKSKSIRVAMRNVKVESIMQEDLPAKWEMLGRLVEEHKKKTTTHHEEKPHATADNLINQWMTVHQPPEKEKYLLDSLKDRMKQKHTVERAKFLEMEKKQKEKEMMEREELEKKQKEEKEAFEKRERDRKEQERLEYERILNKDRDQVKFKPTFKEKSYKKAISPSVSPIRERDREREREKEREHEREREQRERAQLEREREYERNRREKEKRRSRTPEKYKRHSKDRNGHSRSRSRSHNRNESSRSSKHKEKSENKPPGPPSYKRLPFIGRMPLFKNKKFEERVEKEIQKEEYDKPRVTRFEPGNLPRAFIPEPDVVCFPKLSSYPELQLPIPQPVPVKPPPPAPKITEVPKKAPPPPKIEEKHEEPKPPSPPQFKNEDFDPSLYEEPSQLWNNVETSYESMYQSMYPVSYEEQLKEHDAVPISHMMPLLPPPLPPGEDELALLGISADDMAAQTF